MIPHFLFFPVQYTTLWRRGQQSPPPEFPRRRAAFCRLCGNYLRALRAGLAAALSPSIWVAPDKLAGLVSRAKLEPGTVLYMDYGSREMGNHDGMRCGFAEMCSKVLTRGIHLTSRIVPGGTHSEASWEKQLPFVFHTLMYELEEA